MNTAIRCQDLRKQYRTRRAVVDAVNGLDLEIRAGECFGLLGPNGAGKTTTVEILEGLLKPTSGLVEILGEQWGRHDDALRQRIGISLQETRMNEKLTVRETLRLLRSFYYRGLAPDFLIAEVGLTDKAHTWVGKLSGGQRQRLAVACSLVGDPELLFLDEPTTGLDPQSRRQLWDILMRFRKKGRTILLTTHYMDEAERLCDRVAIVDRGKVIALDTPAGLIARLGGEHRIEFALSDGQACDEALLRDIPSLAGMQQAHGIYMLRVAAPHLALPVLVERLASRGLSLSRLTTRHVSLEDVFVSLTGRRLTESGEPEPSENGLDETKA
ncbi:MAG TPA: ABC transporter ATP-binding protein [Gemmataceae bacterium]|jgi:ABC-2 type transport system ATP-binding protein|nr:ABC transporter ATP-binding protein [Gemmataceae bacterium]